MNPVVKLSDHRAKNKAQRDWYRRETRKVILAAVPINIGVRQMLIDDGVIFEHESTAGRPSLTGHCGHGWTCRRFEPVANDPNRKSGIASLRRGKKSPSSSFFRHPGLAQALDSPIKGCTNARIGGWRWCDPRLHQCRDAL